MYAWLKVTHFKNPEKKLWARGSQGPRSGRGRNLGQGPRWPEAPGSSSNIILNNGEY